MYTRYLHSSPLISISAQVIQVVQGHVLRDACGRFNYSRLEALENKQKKDLLDDFYQFQHVIQ